MAIDFNDPTTWDQEMSREDAINIAIFALNTLAHPEGSTDDQFAALDFFTDGSIEVLAQMRDDLDDEDPRVAPKELTTQLQRERYWALIDGGVDDDLALRDARKW